MNKTKTATVNQPPPPYKPCRLFASFAFLFPNQQSASTSPVLRNLCRLILNQQQLVGKKIWLPQKA